MKPLQSSAMLIAVSCYYSCEWIQEMCLHDAWQVSRVFAPVRVCACVSHWSRMPSVLREIGLFPGNWFVQKPGRSSQQWGGNTRPVTLLVMSRDKAERRWGLLCLHVHEKSFIILKHFSQASWVHTWWWHERLTQYFLLTPLLLSPSPMCRQRPSYGFWAWGTLCSWNLTFTWVGSDKKQLESVFYFKRIANGLEKSN